MRHPAIAPGNALRADRKVVLALNSGSSSLKYGLYQVQAGHSACLHDGTLHTSGPDAGTLQAGDGQGRPLRWAEAVNAHSPTSPTSPTSPPALLRRIGALLGTLQLPAPQAIGHRPPATGHRMVHGGPQLRQHVRISLAVLQQLAATSPFAPLHTPAALALIQAALQQHPLLPQVVCLDTCFQAGLPEVASVLALPQRGVRRASSVTAFMACRANPSCSSVARRCHAVC